MLSVNNEIVKIEKFPDGTPKINLKGFNIDQKGRVVNIDWKYESNDELMYLIMIKKHLDELDICSEITLLLLYVPNSRMDRTRSNKEIFTLKYFCETINWLHFDAVYTLDNHSDVSTALLDRCRNFNPSDYIDAVLWQVDDVDNTILYFPDAGSCKRYTGLFTDIPYCYGEKNRDWKTGKILGLDVRTNGIELKGKDILMIDDIISYGGSFFYSAKTLKELGVNKIYAYATHTENSVLDHEKGTLIKSLENGTVERLFTTNSLFTGKHDKITVLEEV